MDGDEHGDGDGDSVNSGGIEVDDGGGDDDDRDGGADSKAVGVGAGAVAAQADALLAWLDARSAIGPVRARGSCLLLGRMSAVGGASGAGGLQRKRVKKGSKQGSKKDPLRGGKKGASSKPGGVASAGGDGDGDDGARTPPAVRSVFVSSDQRLVIAGLDDGCVGLLYKEFK